MDEDFETDHWYPDCSHEGFQHWDHATGDETAYFDALDAKLKQARHGEEE